MSGLLERVADAARPGKDAQRFSVDTWLSDYLIPAVSSFGYNGNTYPYGLHQTLAGQRVQEVSATLPGYLAALRTCPPAFAAQLVRALVLSGVRFTFRNLPSSRTPRRMFGTSGLAPLERPWRNATTGELVARMEWHAGLAGNAYVHRRSVPVAPDAPTGVRLRVLRPDWVGILYGSDLEPDDPAHALDGEVVGYVYANGGWNGRAAPQTLLPGDVAHWSPLPDPECAGIGMSWVTPAVREIQGDQAVTAHKLAYFAQGATPNLVVKGLPFATGQEDAFQRLVAILEAEHSGIENAYKTLYLSAGADATVVGSNLADGWIYPTLADLCHALAPLVDVPADAELWHDTADMPVLREDAKDAAEIEQIKAQTIRALVDGGFDPASVIAAVMGQNMTLLKHSGLVSVQLNPPNSGAPTTNGQPPALAGAKGA